MNAVNNTTSSNSVIRFVNKSDVKTKINLISGAFTPSFADAAWVLSDFDIDAVKRMVCIFSRDVQFSNNAK